MSDVANADDLVERAKSHHDPYLSEHSGNFIDALVSEIVHLLSLLAAAEAERNDAKRYAKALEDQLAASEKAEMAAEARNEIARKALEFIQSFGCPVCGGDCSSANPPMHGCPMDEISRALRSQSSGGGNG